MFARHVTLRLKPNMRDEAETAIRNQIVPLISKQKGLRDLVMLISHDGTEVLGVSLWDSQTDADHYQQQHFAEIQRIAAGFVDGQPQIKTYDVSHSGTHRSTHSSAAH